MNENEYDVDEDANGAVVTMLSLLLLLLIPMDNGCVHESVADVVSHGDEADGDNRVISNRFINTTISVIGSRDGSISIVSNGSIRIFGNR